jgi:hypothetical protein
MPHQIETGEISNPHTAMEFVLSLSNRLLDAILEALDLVIRQWPWEPFRCVQDFDPCQNVRDRIPLIDGKLAKRTEMIQVHVDGGCSLTLPQFIIDVAFDQTHRPIGPILTRPFLV